MISIICKICDNINFYLICTRVLTKNETESSIAFVLENTSTDVLTNITVSLNVIAADLIQL